MNPASMGKPHMMIDEPGASQTDPTRDGQSASGTEISAKVGYMPNKMEYFKIFRQYRISEHNLLNHRLNWSLAIQGFLFATYGFCIQKLVEVPNYNTLPGDHITRDHYLIHVKIFMYVIPTIGILLSICVWFAVWGANKALDLLNDQWREVERLYPRDPWFLNPAGAGSATRVRKSGLLPPLFIPPLFCLAWLALLSCLLIWH